MIVQMNFAQKYKYLSTDMIFVKKITLPGLKFYTANVHNLDIFLAN